VLEFSTFLKLYRTVRLLTAVELMLTTLDPDSVEVRR
jgi:hypothetical protein